MPKLQLPRKLHNKDYSVLTTKARVIVIIGGRGSAKSESVGSLLIHKAQVERADVLCGREFQNSIDESVHKLLKEMIEERLKVADDFNITDKKIDCSTGGGFRFRGFNRNPEAVKSAQGFKFSWIEEAQSISQKTIDDLLPTIRSSGSKLFFTANPQSSTDPFSKRFITPYHRHLLTEGFYEDDMHLIIFMNWRDNPWFTEELEQQRQWDYNNLTRSKYDWIWEGMFNDGVEDALIQPEWFDACIDAHIKLGIEPKGIRMASHDPSDEGSDSKGYAMRHGSVLMRVCEKTTGNVNDGCDWATELALGDEIDGFTWDCDGMGIALQRQVSKAFHGKHTKVAMFKGSEEVDRPDAVFESLDPETNAPVQGNRKNKDALRNKRAQYYYELRKRILNTYNAVVKDQYIDPDQMLCINSDTIDPGILQKLRSEVCRMPIKPNAAGLFELYTKKDMKTKFKVDSPNLADSVMMLTRQPFSPTVQGNVGRPQPIKPMGKR